MFSKTNDVCRRLGVLIRLPSSDPSIESDRGLARSGRARAHRGLFFETTSRLTPTMNLYTVGAGVEMPVVHDSQSLPPVAAWWSSFLQATAAQFVRRIVVRGRLLQRSGVWRGQLACIYHCEGSDGPSLSCYSPHPKILPLSPRYSLCLFSMSWGNGMRRLDQRPV